MDTNLHRFSNAYAVVPLEPTLQPTLQLEGQLQKSGVGDKNPQNVREYTGSVAPLRQDLKHPGFSVSSI